MAATIRHIGKPCLYTGFTQTLHLIRAVLTVARQRDARRLEIGFAFYAPHASSFRLRKCRLGGRQDKGPEHDRVQKEERLPKVHSRKTIIAGPVDSA